MSKVAPSFPSLLWPFRRNVILKLDNFMMTEGVVFLGDGIAKRLSEPQFFASPGCLCGLGHQE
jgi:hypothetical protein